MVASGGKVADVVSVLCRSISVALRGVGGGSIVALTGVSWSSATVSPVNNGTVTVLPVTGSALSHS